ncbi:EthD domain-containing protein [Cladophialophora immunda]|nr:EthD domain-containing protein [Cladophialophora immunda]
MLAFVTRSEHLSVEEFQKHWVENHGPLVGKFLSSMGVLSYRQFHIDQRNNPLGYDGIVQLEIPSLETWGKISSDKYYQEVIVPDEQKFFQSAKMVILTGQNYSVVEGGQYVLNK